MRIGIDLGGTKIEGDRDRGRRRASALRRRIATPRGDYARTLDAIAGLVRDIERELGARGTVGVGIPGRDLAGDRPRQERELDLADRPAARRGSAARCSTARSASRTTRTASRCRRRPTARRPAPRVVFGVIVGTGTGGGVVVDGRVLAGANAIARRVGPQPAAVAARRRVARARRATAAGTAASRRSSRGPGWRATTRRARGATLGAQEIAERGGGGRRAGRRGARALRGSHGARARERHQRARSRRHRARRRAVEHRAALRARAAARGRPHVFSDRVDTRLVRAKHGDSSGVRGAAWLWE